MYGQTPFPTSDLESWDPKLALFNPGRIGRSKYAADLAKSRWIKYALIFAKCKRFET